MGDTSLLVAILDDETSVRIALDRLFRSAGFKTDSFATASAFLESPILKHADCLILDLHLPGQTGMDVLKQVVEKKLPFPIVMITGHDVPGMRERALASGADEYLLKPLDDDVLISAVITSIQRKQSM